MFESPMDPQAVLPRRYINVRHCGGLSMVRLQIKDPLELFVKRREFFPGSWVFVLSQYDLSCSLRTSI